MSSSVFGGFGGSLIGTLGETADTGLALPPVDVDGCAAYAAIIPRPRPSTPQSSATNSPRLLMRRNLPGTLAGSAVTFACGCPTGQASRMTTPYLDKHREK